MGDRDGIVGNDEVGVGWRRPGLERELLVDQHTGSRPEPIENARKEPRHGTAREEHEHDVDAFEGNVGSATTDDLGSIGQASLVDSLLGPPRERWGDLDADRARAPLCGRRHEPTVTAAHIDEASLRTDTGEVEQRIDE